MPAPLRLALLAIAVAAPVTALAACANKTSDATASDTSAITDSAQARFDALLLEAFATSTETNYTTDDVSDASCFSTDPQTRVLDWNVLGGQWFAPTMRVGLTARAVAEQLTVVESPGASPGLLDIRFLGMPTDLDGAPPSLCGGDGGAGAAVVLLTCKNVASTGMMTSITANQCSH